MVDKHSGPWNYPNTSLKGASPQDRRENLDWEFSECKKPQLRFQQISQNKGLGRKTIAVNILITCGGFLSNTECIRAGKDPQIPRAHAGSLSEHLPSITGPSFNLGNKTTVGPTGDKLKYTHIKNYIKCTWFPVPLSLIK